MRSLAIAVALLALLAPAAAGQTPQQFADWTAVNANVATGTVNGATITLSGSDVNGPPATKLDGSSTVFNRPEFTPPLEATDAIHFVGSPGGTYTLEFGAPATDPVLHLGSLASTLTFPAGTQITRLSGDAQFGVADNQVIGQLEAPSDDANGSVRLVGTFTSLPFTATYQGGDGIYLQVGVAPPDTVAPATTIAVDPAEPAPAGAYLAPVGLLVRATDAGSATQEIETRCTLDPAAVPRAFLDLPASCPYLSGGTVDQPGTHTLYAASRDRAGNVEPALVARTFRIAVVPDTQITSPPEPMPVQWSTVTSFSFSASVAGSAFECRMDRGEWWTACASPIETVPLPSGEHYFEVRAVSPDGATDPTPAARAFVISAAVTKPLSCTVRPVRFWILTGWRPEGDQLACQVALPTSAGCPVDMYIRTICRSTTERCPRDARCTLTTVAKWFDADQGVNWGVEAIAAFDATSWPSAWQHTNRRSHCYTGVNGDRCTTTASVTILGTGNPVLIACRGLWPATSGAGNSVQIGPESVRRVECDGHLRVEPATPLQTVATGTSAQIYVPTSGTLAVLASGLTARVAARAAAVPKIARVRREVTAAGPVTVPLTLNAAARRLLRRKGALRTSLRVTFTPTGGQPQTTTTRVTLRHSTRPVACRSRPRPARRPVGRRRALPSCPRAST